MHFGKIVATLGPASESARGIASLVAAGVDVFRLNFSHGSHDEQGQRVAHIRDIERESGRSFGVIADLQGPKLRVGEIGTADDGVALSAGSAFAFYLEEKVGDVHGVSLAHPEIFTAAKAGMDILVDDGRLRFRVETVHPDVLEATVVVGGVIRRRKGVNVPGVRLPISAITEKDAEDMAFALSCGVDWVALSFVQQVEDVRKAKRAVSGKTGVIAKIEKPSALECIEDIINEVDAIMVARGDLGVEIPPEEVPSEQKRILSLCRQAGKPAIVATHMLESMVSSPYPTRAEVSDVANAVYDGTDAVMLSAETAAGEYPAEAAAMMRRIVKQAVGDSVFFSVARQMPRAADFGDMSAHAAMQEEQYSAVVTASSSFDDIVRYACRRAVCPLFVITADQHLARRLALVWGVVPLCVEDAEHIVKDEDAMITFVQQRYTGDGTIGVVTF